MPESPLFQAAERGNAKASVTSGVVQAVSDIAPQFDLNLSQLSIPTPTAQYSCTALSTTLTVLRHLFDS